MKRKIAMLLTFLMCVSTFTLPVHAVTEKTNLQNKEFTVDSTSIVFADPDDGPSYSGSSIGNSYTDTRTEEEKAEDALIAKREELEEKINEIINQINNGQAGDDAWNELPDFGDWVGDNGWNGGSDVDIGDVTLPDWALPENPDLEDWELPDLDDLWDQFLTDKGIIPNFPDGTNPINPSNPINPDLPDYSFDPDDIITGDENEDIMFDGVVIQPTQNGMMTVEQVSVPIGTFVTLAGINAQLKPENQVPIDVPDEIPEIEITDHDKDEQVIPTLPDLPTGTIDPGEIEEVEQLPFDFEKWLDEFKQWILDKFPVKPGENSEATEDQFIQSPSIDDAEDMFPGLIDQGTLPGTDIDVGFSDNNEDLYSLLFLYMMQLRELNLTKATVTKFTIYQMSDYDIQTIHTSTPTDEYRWVVSGPGGSVDKVTKSPYAKLLFRAAGDYDVDIFNTQEVYRNNKVTGTRSEIWVLSNGGFFDGLIVYQATTQFSGFISEDIGPTMEEVPMVDNSFTANVSESMLNQIQLIDKYGNLKAPTEGFMTERS